MGLPALPTCPGSSINIAIPCRAGPGGKGGLHHPPATAGCLLSMALGWHSLGSCLWGWGVHMESQLEK